MHGHIKKRAVKSINKLNNSANTTTSNSEIDETSDYLWLFSNAEMWYNYGSGTDSTYRYSEEAYFVNSAETTYQRTKNMQPNGTSMSSPEGISIYQYYINASPSWAWLRSPGCNSNNSVSGVCYNGDWGYNNADGNRRCAPGFVVG